MLEEKGILIDLIEESTTYGESASLPLRFRYHSESSSASVHEIMERTNDRMKVFHYRPQSINGNVPLDATAENLLHGGPLQITGQTIAYFVHRVRNNGKAFV